MTLAVEEDVATDPCDIVHEARRPPVWAEVREALAVLFDRGLIRRRRVR